MKPIILCSLAISVLISCAVNQPGQPFPEDEHTAEPVSMYVLESPAVQGANSQEEGIGTSEDQEPFTELYKLWSRGRQEEARALFWSDAIKRDASLYRSDEWRMWRGRLYVDSWSGSSWGLAGENISALLVDGDDIWAGTWTGGLARYSVPLDERVAFDPGMPSLAVRTINRIQKHREDITVVRYGEISEYNSRNARWKTMEGLPVGERIQDIHRESETVLVGSLGDGLWSMEGNTWKRVYEPGLFINRIEKGRNGELLIATMDRGLYVYDIQSDRWTRPRDPRLRDVNVTSATVHGELIVGGTYGQGAFVWNRIEDSVEFFDEQVLGDPWVLSVISNGDWVYFATFGAGLNAWNPGTGARDRLEIADGLPNGDIASLASGPDGSIWAGSLGGGIVRIREGILGE